MDDRQIGARIRAIRLRRGWRQDDLAERSGTSRWTVLRIERGRIGSTRLDVVRRVADAMDARLAVRLEWHGGDLERLVSHRHSAMHELLAGRFAALPEWVAAPEVSFSIYGERGAIDVLAFHERSRSLLVVELKTEIVDIQELLGSLDRKCRLAPVVARGRGWRPDRVGVWLIVAEGRTNRRRVEAHRTLLQQAVPDTSRHVGRWLSDPGTPPLRALSFMSDVQGSRTRSALATPRRASPCRSSRSASREIAEGARAVHVARPAGARAP